MLLLAASANFTQITRRHNTGMAAGVLWQLFYKRRNFELMQFEVKNQEIILLNLNFADYDSIIPLRRLFGCKNCEWNRIMKPLFAGVVPNSRSSTIARIQSLKHEVDKLPKGLASVAILFLRSFLSNNAQKRTDRPASHTEWSIWKSVSLFY